MQIKRAGRPKHFSPKPERTSVNRFRRTTRPTPAVMNAAKAFSGPDEKKVGQAAALVIDRIPHDFRIEKEPKRIFRRTAEQAMKRRVPIGYLHCAERCNLAIALLNAAGMKAWLAREIDIDTLRRQVYFHDFVETMINGKVHTLLFHVSGPVIDSYDLREGPANKAFPEKKFYMLRGADSKQIGGIGNWKEFRRYAARFKNNPQVELEKDRRRVALMIREGIIPKEAAGQLG